jgi:hypothetical protein
MPGILEKKQAQARGPSSPTCTLMPSFILFNFLTGRSPRFSLNKIVNDTLSALCKIQRSEVAGKTRCQFSPLKTHFNLFFDQKHHKHLHKSINDLKNTKKKKKLKNLKSTCLQKHSHDQICLFGQVEEKKNT